MIRFLVLTRWQDELMQIIARHFYFESRRGPVLSEIVLQMRIAWCICIFVRKRQLIEAPLPVVRLLSWQLANWKAPTCANLARSQH